mgnify:CR=1 FL=1
MHGWVIIDVKLQFPWFGDILLHQLQLLFQQGLIFGFIKSKDVFTHIIQPGQGIKIFIIHQSKVQTLIEFTLDVRMIQQPPEDLCW